MRALFRGERFRGARGARREVRRRKLFDFTQPRDGRSVSRRASGRRRSPRCSLFSEPRAVAVVGASRDAESIGYRILRELVLNRFQRPGLPGQQKRRGGGFGSRPTPRSKRCPVRSIWPSSSCPPEEVVRGGRALRAKRGCARSSSSARASPRQGMAGLERQQALLGCRSRGYGMRLVGPNCLGILNTNPEVRLNASFSHTFPGPRPGRARLAERRAGSGRAGLGGGVGPGALELCQPRQRRGYFGQRPHPVLGTRPRHAGDFAVLRDLRQPAPLRAAGAAHRPRPSRF